MRGAESLSFASFNVHMICVWEALNKCLFNEWKPQTPRNSHGAYQRCVWGFFLFWGFLRVPPEAVAVGGPQKLSARPLLLGSSVQEALLCAAVCCGGGPRGRVVTEEPVAWSKTNGSKSCLDHLLTVWLWVSHSTGLSLSSLILEFLIRWQLHSKGYCVSRGVSPVTRGPHAARDGCECGPTHNRKFT